MTPKARRLGLLAAMLTVSAGLGVLAYGSIGENLVYYWDADEVVAAGQKAVGATIRMGGVVQAETVDWDSSTHDLRFAVSGGENSPVRVPVHATAAPPQMFREGIGVVVEGTMTAGGTFEADRVMVKHSNEYRAPVEGQDPKELYKTVEDL